MTQSEFEAVGLHVCNSQATGDLIYASSATQLTRLAVGSASNLLQVSGGIPSWTSEIDNITLDTSVAKGTWTAAGTWTIPAVTLGGIVTLGGQQLSGNASFGGGSFTFNQVTEAFNADAGSFLFRTGNAAQAAVSRLAISGTIDTAVATWTSITHTGLVITSAGTVEGAGTGVNGFKLKNLKNAAATALSGTQLDVEIDIGGTPYYFTVYPTKA